MPHFELCSSEAIIPVLIPSYLAFYLIESASPHIRYSLTEYWNLSTLFLIPLGEAGEQDGCFNPAGSEHTKGEHALQSDISHNIHCWATIVFWAEDLPCHCLTESYNNKSSFPAENLACK